MRNATLALVFGLVGLAAGSLLSSQAAAAAAASYGEDRAQIEDLQARYEGDVKGREAIVKVIGGMRGG